MPATFPFPIFAEGEVKPAPAQAQGDAPAAKQGTAGTQKPAKPEGGPANPPQEPNFLVSFAPLMIVGVLFWFILIRPRQNEEKRYREKMEELRSNLKQNDRVLTASGIYGTVVNISADKSEVTLRIDDNNNTRIRVTRESVLTVLNDSTPDAKPS